MPPDDAPNFPLFRADWEQAEAAVLAADGTLSTATERALKAARTAAANGAWASVLLAAHDASRYSGSAEAAALVTTAADRISGPLPQSLNAYSQARATSNPLLLADVSRQLAEIGAILFAADPT